MKLAAVSLIFCIWLFAVFTQWFRNLWPAETHEAKNRRRRHSDFWKFGSKI